MAGTAPNYDNVRMGGPDGIRIPQEVGKAVFATDNFESINVGGAGTTNTVNLNDSNSLGSYYVMTNAGSGATTVNWPAAFPGHIFGFFNNSGQASTLEAAAAGGITGPADGKYALFTFNATAVVRLTADL